MSERKWGKRSRSRKFLEKGNFSTSKEWEGEGEREKRNEKGKWIEKEREKERKNSKHRTGDTIFKTGFRFCSELWSEL